ncbi:hypothetical protein F2Q69_00007194 [Brassica cretica]|uniref:Uncharacterized protein n=1 Tax=Brassica cretica TaxID=69181 RepID=A0A8S9PET3_BRACR|nr:hypothetical protein F2Q69_00007194 [Brassica cretica]
MFFRESGETEEDIDHMFHQIRKKMKQRVVLKKKSDARKFAVSCMIGGYSYPNALYDTCSLVRIMPRVMADQQILKIERSGDSFSFADCSKVNSVGIVKNLQVQIGNALVSVDFHVMDNQIDLNSSLLLERAFMVTVGAVCNMKTNHMCLTLIYNNALHEM